MDINSDMLVLARKNLGTKIKLYRQDMRKLHIPVRADILVCLFNSINYNLSYKELKDTLTRFYNHLKPGGVVVFDSAFTKSNWKEGYFGAQVYTVDGTNVARVNKSTSRGDIGTVYITYIIQRGAKKDIIETENVIMLLDPKKVLGIMKRVGFKTTIYHDFSTRKSKGKIVVFVGKK